ncbi:MAG: hypothetical protein WC152_04875 [Candidatus Izemoplasmatales bacterium]
MENDKRLKYIIDMDPIFIAQNIIMILSGFERFSIEKSFKDPIKLSSLIYIVTSEEYINVVNGSINNELMNKKEYEILMNLKLKSKLVMPVVNRVLNLLHIKNIIGLSICNGETSIYVNKNSLSLFENDIYKPLSENVGRLRKIYSRIPSTTEQNYHSRVFGVVTANE